MKRKLSAWWPPLVTTKLIFFFAASAYGIDRDKNGWNDFFQLLYPTITQANRDEDADGQTNAQEQAAGTNPLVANSHLRLKEVQKLSSELRLKFQTTKGKLYQLQRSETLGSGSWANEGSSMIGSGDEMTAVCPAQEGSEFFRLAVGDVDSDGDGLNDWEEALTGTNPLLTDSNDDGLFDDYQTVLQQLSASNVVEVIANKSITSEGADVMTAGEFTIRRRGGLGPLTVNYSLSGSATRAADYSVSATGSVFFSVGQTTATVRVMPVADTLTESDETVVLTLASGTSYTLSGQNSATVTIVGTPGTGLRGLYYDNASATYTSPNNFSGAPKERLDPIINFTNWGQGRPHPDLVDDDYHSVIWTGQIMSPVTETVVVGVTANSLKKLWIDGRLVIDQWDTATSNILQTANVPMVAGRFYPVRFEFADEAGTTSVQLSWSIAGAAHVPIPTANLYPLPLAAPVITSQPYIFAISGGPVNYAVTATNSPTSYSAIGLPNGWTINATTGVISGTGSATVGQTFATVIATNAAGSDARTVTIITQATTGNVPEEVWENLPGSYVQNGEWHTSPTRSSTLLTSLQTTASNYPNSATRVRGLLTAPQSGEYQFFLTTENEDAEFWLSADATPGRKLRRCAVRGVAAAGSYTAQPQQASLPVRLKAGQKYYFELLCKDADTAIDVAKVAWRRPSDGLGTIPIEVVPGYCLNRYIAPEPLPPGTLIFTATMRPQNNAKTQGQGTATLTLNPAQTEAKLTYSYSGLSGPIISQHIHDGSSVGSNSSANGPILFDIDTEQPNTQGQRTWTLIPTGNHTVANIRALLLNGKTYINLHTAAYPAGEISGTFVLANGAQEYSPPLPPPASWTVNSVPDDIDAYRLLQQATFGMRGLDANGDGTYDDIAEVKTKGFSQWIDDQMNQPAVFLRPQVSEFYKNFPNPPDFGTPESVNEIVRFWWKSAMTSPDQLRQRVAHALSQILVVSEIGELDENATALTAYYDILLDEAFGNFRNLLERVTLNYTMGRYLDMAGNKKADPTKNRTANENYAREIMQLFSIGLRRLHPDGRMIFDANNQPIPTYDQDVVVGLANSFTGWNRVPIPNSSNGLPPFDYFRQEYVIPMRFTATDHDYSAKLFLENTILPANTLAETELDNTHDILFYHPNTAPFICRQLIQRLVTANPTPGYIRRVSAVFENNGSGVRGDMRAVVRALLLDPEARSKVAAAEPRYGNMREPLLRLAALLRGLNAVSKSAGQPHPHIMLNPAYDGNNLSVTVPRFLERIAPPVPPSTTSPVSPGWSVGVLSGIEQNPLRSPTVFNFYEPDFVYNGHTGAAGLYAPEFQITHETTVVRFANMIHDLIGNSSTTTAAGLGNNTNWNEKTYRTHNPATDGTPNGYLVVDGKRYSFRTVNGVNYPVSPILDSEGRDVQIDVSALRALAYSVSGSGASAFATDTSALLLDRLNGLLFGHRLVKDTSGGTSTTYGVIYNHLNRLRKRVAGVNGATATNEADDRHVRVRDAIYLLTMSPDFSVQK